MGRSRRHVGEEKKEVVTYTIGPDRIVEVEEWEPKTYLPVGGTVELAVAARVYQGRVVFSLATSEEVF